MPPFRQPTPSPPPPPVPVVVSSAAAVVAANTASSSVMNMSSSSSSISETNKAPPPGGGASSSSSAAAAKGGFEIPANFIPPPPPREVATGVSNLGNTCYMNAALQALAHAPELCHALDAESHIRKCPVALRNERRRRKRVREIREAAIIASKGDGDADTATAEATEGVGQGDHDAKVEANSTNRNGKNRNSSKTKKSHRRSNSSSSNGSNGSKGSKGSKKRAAQDVLYDPDYEYCTLCEVERLLGRVHCRPPEDIFDPATSVKKESENNSPNFNSSLFQEGGPFVPETFVSGFMGKVAPWFRRGVQEDSHEFLRLLIDAMQTSCKGARNEAAAKKVSSNSNNEDEEYPFRLFRGTVESNVKCSACRSTSCKIDPIEDIGLDILPIKPTPSPTNNSGSSTRGGGYGSRSTSPTGMGGQLADVTQALERFISSEHLDSGYKCEKCGKLGKATKTSKLASIPPILTLHLKRFRYGAGGGGSKRGGGYSGSYNDNAAPVSSTRSSRSARGSGGGALPNNDFDGNSHVGPSGSAKIEGHVRFDQVLEMKPYLTSELQRTVFQKMAICRLFAVVVHSGKNSHSGHYVAYVHNVTKRGEWWKMDDAKVVRSSWEEVRNAEAYMLFYRVTSHPVAMRLKSVADAKEMEARRVVEEIKRREEAVKAAVKEEARKKEEEEAKRVAAKAAAKVFLQEVMEKKKKISGSSKETKSAGEKVPDATPSSDVETPTSSPVSPALGKRSRPSLASGEEWARAATTLSPEYLPLFSRIQEFITDNVTFSPEFFGYITEEYNRMLDSKGGSVGRRVKNNKRIKKNLLGKGPGGVYPEEDCVGGAVDIQGGILDLFHQISIMYKNSNKNSGGENGGSINIESFILPKIEEKEVVVVPTTPPSEVKDENKKSASTNDEAITAPEVVPGSPELIVAADNMESYDGAL